MMDWDVNYLAALVAAVAAMVLGAIYYAPPVAGRAWMNAIGKTREELRASSGPLNYIVTAILTYLQAVVLAALIGWRGTVSLENGVLVGLLTWIGFALPIVGVVFLFEGRRFSNVVISAVFYLISLVVMGGIIGLWG